MPVLSNSLIPDLAGISYVVVNRMSLCYDLAAQPTSVACHILMEFWPKTMNLELDFCSID